MYTKAQDAKKEKAVLEADAKYTAVKKEFKKRYGTSKKRTKKTD